MTGATGVGAAADLRHSGGAAVCPLCGPKGEPIIIPLPYVVPPLTLNARLGKHEQDARVASIRYDVANMARSVLRGLHANRVRLELHYRPQRRNRRDGDNLVATLKPAADALVDCGLVPDDAPQYMDKIMPIIELPERGRPGALWLAVIVLA